VSLSPADLRKIGGSDVAAILGRDPHKSAVDVWRRIVDGVEPEVDPEKAKLFRRGNLLEPVIRQMAWQDFGLALAGPGRWDCEVPYLRASLDDRHMLDPEDEAFDVVEFKSVSPDAAHQWGQEGTDQVPTNYLLQVQFYLWVTGATKARVIPLIGVDDLRQYFVTANIDLHNLIAEATEEFWHKNVLEKVAPPPDGSDSYSEYLRQRYPTRTGVLIEADDALTQLCADHREARDQADAWDERRKVLAQQIAVRLDGNDGAEGYLPTGEKWRVTNRISKGRPSIDWESISLELNLPPDFKEKFSRRTPSPVFTNKVLAGRR
jgi:putative phage-type endonuclease